MEEKRHRSKASICAILGVAVLFVWYAVMSEDRQGELTFAVLDVGQGDALFIESPTGNQLLLDGGPSRAVVERLSDVMPVYDRTIDLVSFSHPHRDHFEGLIEVLERYDVGAVATPGTVGETPEYAAFARGASSTLALRRGDRIDLGGGAVLEVLFPVVNSREVSPHQGMLVMMLRYGETAILLTGDAERNIEQYLAGRDGSRLKADVLKVAHHGSETSTSDVLLSLVHPTYAVISSGTGNAFGHPEAVVLDRLAASNIQTYRTDQLGTVVFKSDGYRVWVED